MGQGAKIKLTELLPLVVGFGQNSGDSILVRVPTKSCPNLSRLFDDAEPALLSGFLNFRSFQREKWLDGYKHLPGGESREMLRKEPKERLGPLEREAARVVEMSSVRGQYAMEGIAEKKLAVDRRALMIGQRDELARSLWTYLNELILFEATENSLHMKLYRRYDRHYQTFMAEPSTGADPESDSVRMENFLAEVGKALNRGSGYNLERFEIPGESGTPDSELYLLSHPKSPTSIREMSDDGTLSNIYLRTPGEAAVVYFPSTGLVHVRAATRALRHLIANNFIATVLEQTVSSQPVDFQAYDIRQFRGFAVLSRPNYPDVVIEAAKLIKVEVSIGDLSNRLAVSTTIDGDLALIAGQQDGLLSAFESAIATRFVEFAVKYRRKNQDNDRTLNFTVTDRNTCSLLSVEDPFDAILGHRLMQHWGVSREGRAPTSRDSLQALPALLSLWETGAEKVLGAWLVERGVETALLVEVGFLVPDGAGDEGDFDVVDDEDSVGAVAAEIISRSDGPWLRISPGQEAPGGSMESYRVYRVRRGWVAQHLRTHMAEIFGSAEPINIGGDLVRLGQVDIDGTNVPIYLARGLKDGEARERTEAQLWANKGVGIGLVLQAGTAPGTCISGNVLTRAVDHMSGTFPEFRFNIDSLRDAYRHNVMLARGGEKVAFIPVNSTEGNLYVPGKTSIFISGQNRFQVINKLVEAHKSGRKTVTSQELRKDISDQSLSNIFGSDLWKRLQDGFVRQPKRPLWEIAAEV